MARYLGVSDIIGLIQKSLPAGSLAVAYFTRDREYEYYTFDSFEDLAALLKDRDPTDFEIYKEGGLRVDFSIDQWLIFVNKELANVTLQALKCAFPGEPDDNE